MAVELAQIDLSNLPAGWAIEGQPQAFRHDRSTDGGIEPNIVVRCVPCIPDTDDVLGVPIIDLNPRSSPTSSQAGDSRLAALSAPLAQ
jgi:hypothetical protein